jgi:hypothetical protein
VLAPLNFVPTNYQPTAPLFAFGEELGGDLAAATNVADRLAFARFARVLGRLRWSNRSTAATIRRFVSASTAKLTLAPSDLCADARVLAADSATTPSGTLAFLARFARIEVAADRGIKAFVHVLGRLESPADNGIVSRINRLVHQIGKAASKLVNTVAPRLESTLGLAV